eukprot:scaffold71027_cov58-Cyclotella_meneghiniana.AAC.1
MKNPNLGLFQNLRSGLIDQTFEADVNMSSQYQHTYLILVPIKGIKGPQRKFSSPVTQKSGCSYDTQSGCKKKWVWYGVWALCPEFSARTPLGGEFLQNFQNLAEF